MKKTGVKDEAKAREPGEDKIYRLKISLAYVYPPLWRRLEVYAGMDMASLATAIKVVFGWSGDHMCEFDIKGRRIGDGGGWALEEDPRAMEKEFRRLFEEAREAPKKGQDPRLPAKLLSSFAAKYEQSVLAKLQYAIQPAQAAEEPKEIPVLRELVPRVRTKFKFIYDFGDNWEHDLEVEKILPPEPRVAYPRCTGGARADPLEDCGGIWGYEQMIQAVGHPEHERYADLVEWGLKKWDSEKFSVQETDRSLAKAFQRKGVRHHST
jgi:hypothetical protein